MTSWRSCWCNEINGIYKLLLEKTNMAAHENAVLKIACGGRYLASFRDILHPERGTNLNIQTEWAEKGLEP